MSAQALHVQYLQPQSVDGARLVCLHGWGFDHQSLRPLARELQANSALQIELIDLPGFGLSPPPVCAAEGATNVDASLNEWAAATVALLARHIAQDARPVYLLGWSLGGQLALHLARQARVEGVFTLAANVQFCAQPHWPDAMDAAHYHAFVSGFADKPAITLKRFSQLVAAGGSGLGVKALREYASAHNFDNPAQLRAWLQALQALAALDATAAPIDVPVHMAFGELDALVPNRVMAALDCAPFSQQWPARSLTQFEGCGHDLPLAAPGQVAAWVLARLPQNCRTLQPAGASV
ncbi:alpha/beta hydrolase [Simiduia sp. 21SJ11W-1]|uniref:alpha/beta fold hydrolase n=1 Tax=Simiduia sp. 21SJ11W-1 TaxID=2909669 RepID=UPI00209E98A5|nr:alpha/beta fold hydrolase [Simiduia sp. 21SJ11W-1]UTA47543.1 alpha/beta hydrolase [Simiduia sp. 21SJ11W-1]